MRVHLAGSRMGDPISIEAVLRTSYPYHLISFAYPRDGGFWSPAWRHHPSSIIVDSGAFTAFTLGKPLSLAKYAGFIRSFDDHYPMLAGRVFVNLDVIGDQDATWRNYRRLRDRGCDVIPVVTFGSPMDDIRRAADAGYVCLGGLVGRGGAALRWLDDVYDTLSALPELPRTHLLGVSSRSVLMRYPAYSCDASSWISPFQFGARMHGRKIPNYHESDANRSAMQLHMTRRVESFAQLGRDITNYWTQRGIAWT